MLVRASAEQDFSICGVIGTRGSARNCLGSLVVLLCFLSPRNTTVKAANTRGLEA